MPAQELKDNLLKPVSDFWRNDVAEWLDAVDERFFENLKNDDWWPGVESCLKGVYVPIVRFTLCGVRVVPRSRRSDCFPRHIGGR